MNYCAIARLNHSLHKYLNVTKMSHDSELLAKLLSRPDLKIVNEKDKNGWTPLMFSVQLNATGFVRLLMRDNRVDPNIRDKEGNSPLMAAVLLNHVGCVEAILPDPRADLSERSSQERSGEDVARYQQFFPRFIVETYLSLLLKTLYHSICIDVVTNVSNQDSGRAKEYSVRDTGGLGQRRQQPPLQAVQGVGAGDQAHHHQGVGRPLA